MNYTLLYVVALCMTVACNHDKANQHTVKDMKKYTVKEIVMPETTEIVEIFEVSEGVSIKRKELNKSEYDRLLTGASEPIERFMNKYNRDIRSLKDNKFISRSNDSYMLYYSINDIEIVLETFKKGTFSAGILLNKNPYGSAFPEYVDTLVDRLLTALNISDRTMSLELLRNVDAKINALSEADAVMFRRYNIINLIAIIGKVTISTTKNAEWMMEQGSDGVTWYPLLRIRNQRVQFITYLCEDVFDRIAVHEPVISEIYLTVSDIGRINLK